MDYIVRDDQTSITSSDVAELAPYDCVSSIIFKIIDSDSKHMLTGQRLFMITKFICNL